MFLQLESDLHTFVDNNTVTVIGLTILELKCELQGKVERAIELRIENGNMIANPEKFKAIVLAKGKTKHWLFPNEYLW